MSLMGSPSVTHAQAPVIANAGSAWEPHSPKSAASWKDRSMRRMRVLMPYWKDIWKRHKDKILAAILAIFLIIIISLSATHGKTKKVYVDTSGQGGTKSRYRTYYLT